MATHAYRRSPVGALISIALALAIGSAPAITLVALNGAFSAAVTK